jgi:hypothetical protein
MDVFGSSFPFLNPRRNPFILKIESDPIPQNDLKIIARAASISLVVSP